MELLFIAFLWGFIIVNALYLIIGYKMVCEVEASLVKGANLKLSYKNEIIDVTLIMRIDHSQLLFSLWYYGWGFEVEIVHLIDSKGIAD